MSRINNQLAKAYQKVGKLLAKVGYTGRWYISIMYWDDKYPTYQLAVTDKSDKFMLINNMLYLDEFVTIDELIEHLNNVVNTILSNEQN